MKKIITAIIIATVSISIASAQASFGVKAGFNSSTYVIGVEKVSSTVNLGNNPGFYFGGQASIPVSDIFAFQPELVYSYDGTKLGIKGSLLKDMGAPPSYTKDLAASLNMHNINIPLLFKLSPSESLGIMAGPYVSYSIEYKANFNKNLKKLIETDGGIPTGPILDTIEELMKDNLNKLNVGLSFGAEYVFDSGFFIEARYNLGLLNTLKKEVNLEGVGIEFEEGVFTSSWEDLIEAPVQPKLKYQSFQIGIGYRF